MPGDGVVGRPVAQPERHKDTDIKGILYKILCFVVVGSWYSAQPRAIGGG